MDEDLVSGLFVVAVMLSKNEASGNVMTQTTTQTMSWAVGTREQVVGRAIEFATKQKPGFRILDYIVGEIKGDNNPSSVFAEMGTP